MKNFKQYLKEALRSEVNTDDAHITSRSTPRYTPGIARRIITALGGAPISPKNAEKVAAMNKAGEDKTKREREEGDAAVLRYKKRAADDAATSRKLSEMKMDPNPRPIDSSRYGGRPTSPIDSSRYGGRPTSPPMTGHPPIDYIPIPKPNPKWDIGPAGGPRPKSPPITGHPPIDPKHIPKPGQRPSKTRGGKPNPKEPKPDKGGNHPMYEDSGERAGGPEDGNTGYGLPRKNSRFYPAKNPRPTGPGTEWHMETLRQKYEARKAAEAAAAAAEAAKSAGEQEPEHWRDFPTDVRYDQYGDQD